ncbi:TPA: DUF3226 domain-containing protein [Pseudomonas aeruginosa]|uniref:DUF3226 domain-containing protein n=1 Tax=Pseudomonas aeruginosa TaxID=287 RepID=UPI002D7B9CFA|nr:hypothetical protein [Pseudomonas aeruginosa]HCE6436840.1 hypothetical protein [Pseudomonas aeruginosa]HEP8358780.1 hypothetical protein [Pseudomonas aeruginosa]
MAFKHEGPKVLLTEGVNDCHLISALCNHYKIPDGFGLYECGSDNQAIRRLSALIASSEKKEIIGIVIDADAPSLAGRWSAIKTRLEQEGYTVPDEPHEGGTILASEGKPRIGVWLMPDNQVNGMLEDFCERLAPPDAIRYASECASEARARGVATYKELHNAKARIHTYLAWQDEPGMPLGRAVSAKVLDPGQPIARLFKEFLVNLFIKE